MKFTAHDTSDTPESGVVGREWHSETRLFGLPLLHMAFGRNSSGNRLKAKGIIAIGQYASGGLCISQFGIGLICISQFSIAGLSISQFTIAAFAFAQFGVLLDGYGQFALRLLNIL